MEVAMKVSEALSKYADWRRQSGYAENTVKNDRNAVQGFVRAVGDIHVADINVHHMDSFLGGLALAGLSPGTINVTRASMSKFFSWCRERELMPANRNPIGTRRPVPMPPRSAVRVPVSKFTELLNRAANPRDRMLLACGLYLLGRQSEITNIRIKDVDLASGEVRMVIQKSRIEDRMPISAEMDVELRTYLKWYVSQVGDLNPEYYLVPAVRVAPPDYQPVIRPMARMSKPEDIVRRSLEKIGVTGKRIGLHTLRRSAARAIFDEMESRGYDGALRMVSAWLHHASTTTSEVYLGLDLDKKKRDEEAKGTHLYPSLAQSNIIPIGRGHEADVVSV